jgi:hypothetical protein
MLKAEQGTAAHSSRCRLCNGGDAMVKKAKKAPWDKPNPKKKDHWDGQSDLAFCYQ